MNNRTLTIIFLVCVVLFGATWLFRGHRQSSFDPVIAAVDTMKVDRIKFISGGPSSEEFELKKSGADSWDAVQGDKKIQAPISNVKSVINQLAELNAQSLKTKDPDKYAEYEITEDKASRVIVWEGNKQVADLWIGGFKFDQAARSASSYIRVAGKPEVYLVDGFLSMSLKQKFSQYRDKKLLKADANDLTKLEWNDASGNKQVFQKDGTLWHNGSATPLDTNAIKQYLKSLAMTQGTEFSQLTSTTGLNLIEELSVNGNNMVEPTVISAYASQDAAKPFLIHSSVNPDAVFVSDTVGIYKRIFKDLRQFWPHGK